MEWGKSTSCVCVPPLFDMKLCIGRDNFRNDHHILKITGNLTPPTYYATMNSNAAYF